MNGNDWLGSLTEDDAKDALRRLLDRCETESGPEVPSGCRYLTVREIHQILGVVDPVRVWKPLAVVGPLPGDTVAYRVGGQSVVCPVCESTGYAGLPREELTHTDVGCKDACDQCDYPLITDDPVCMYRCGVRSYCLTCAPTVAQAHPSPVVRSGLPAPGECVCDICGGFIHH